MIDLDDLDSVSGARGQRLQRLAATGAAVRALMRGTLPRVAQFRADEVGGCAVLVSDRLPQASATTLSILLGELGAPLTVPTVCLPATAPFPRAADVVVIVSVTGGEHTLLDALQVATARGATTIVAAPEASPIACYAVERRSIVATWEGDDPANAWWAAYAAAVASWRGSQALDELAATLDHIAAQVGPVAPIYRNPAKQLADIDCPLLLIASDVPTEALAVGLDDALATSNRSVRYIDVRRGFAEFATMNAATDSGARDVFYDPQVDRLPGAEPDWQIVLLPTVVAEQLAQDAATAASAYGAVLAPELERVPDGEWMAAGYVLLAQISGAYRALLRGQE